MAAPGCCDVQATRPWRSEGGKGREGKERCCEAVADERAVELQGRRMMRKDKEEKGYAGAEEARAADFECWTRLERGGWAEQSRNFDLT
jgi:hypothetical protein